MFIKWTYEIDFIQINLLKEYLEKYEISEEKKEETER